ncbi:glycosyltransferase family 2 protein [Algoriphagus mannitolivorans]|uniref:glycosyltransferase family 2 protein n=1 Tax=Algoriphagus mannitolivorans TaxID=226504 RepID=UPI0003FA24D4|nr:glycosyltransferase family 2 protein [Algoriphagus mannitolivorans]
MKYKITAIFVAYNPDLEALKKSARILKDQGCEICLVNNSVEEIEPFFPYMKVINFGKNKGIAQAQSTGMEWAFQENKSDFILQMDQDSIPAPDLVENLLSAWETLTLMGQKIGLIGSLDIDKDTFISSQAKINKGKEIGETGLIAVSEILSSGSLIPKSTFQHLGGPDPKLFIDLVDFEYCWRINYSGLKVIKNPSAKIYHKLGEGKVKVFGLLPVGLPKPFRHYYSVRNTVYIVLNGEAPIFWKVSNIFKLLFKLIIYPFALPQGKERFKFIVKGLKDGVMKRFEIINA